MSEPLQATDAEVSLLGAAMSGYPDLDDLAEIIEPADFYNPFHEAVWDAIQRVHAAGNKPDPVSVRFALADAEVKHDPTRLLDFCTMVPIVAQAPYYAQQVAEAAGLRRIQTAGIKVQQIGSTPGELEDKQERARQAVDDATRGRTTSRARTLADLLPDVIDTAQHGQSAVLGTGWADLDRLIGGLAPGRLVLVGARPGVGKALALDTPLPTPTGWTTMGEIRVGDYLLDRDGRPTRVTGATEVMADRECYRVTFDDGATVIADAQHQWLTSTRASRRAATPPGGYVFKRDSPFSRDQRGGSEQPVVKTTQEIADTVRVGSDRRPNHAVDVCAPLDLPDADLLIDPYVLGAWLGDGSSRVPQITTEDAAVVEEIIRRGYPCRKLAGPLAYSMASPRDLAGGRVKATGLGADLRALHLLQNKHIPAHYLRASRAQRLDLLRGLMDTDGTVGRNGRCVIALTNHRLARDTAELVTSLGMKPSFTQKVVRGRTPASSISYQVGFTTAERVALLPRKADRLPSVTRSTTRQRLIISVERVESVPVRCVEVDNAEHLYLATRAMIPTHNSVMGTNLALHFAAHHEHAVLLASMEMPESEVGQRMLAAYASVNLTGLQMGQTDERAWARIAEHTERLRSLPITIDDAPSQTLAAIRRAARNLQRQRDDLALIVVDYLQLVRPSDTRVNRAEQVTEISRGLKLLARETGACVVAMAQVNREGAKNADGRPRLTDLREGGVENDADQVILMHQPDENIPELELFVEKNRHGPKGVARLQMQGHYARLVSVQWSPVAGIA